MLMIILWLMACAYMDAREQRVPNALTLPMMALALLQLALHQSSLSNAPASAALIAAGLALVLTLPGFILARLGGGDVKLLLALGLASSPPVVLASFIYGSVALACWALVRRWRFGTNLASPEMAFAPSLLFGVLLNMALPLQMLIDGLVSA